jgi:hypothetical protein
VLFRGVTGCSGDFPLDRLKQIEIALLEEMQGQPLLAGEAFEQCGVGGSRSPSQYRECSSQRPSRTKSRSASVKIFFLAGASSRGVQQRAASVAA